MNDTADWSASREEMGTISMLTEALTALTTAGGAAVVQAAGTDAWTTVRVRVARLFGRGREQEILEELDATREDLARGGSGEDAAAIWAERLAELLRNLNAEERSAVTDRLRELVPAHSSPTAGGPVFHGDVSIRADHGVAGAVFNGTVHLENPRSPGRSGG
ncbi:hypothetical protein [Streptomyces sviceus]|uniref:hypothetical protein n=1 Tax=Streptomyces sviceus TaxID=285530 RepID=UPI0036F12D17